MRLNLFYFAFVLAISVSCTSEKNNKIYTIGENSHQLFTGCTIEGTTDFIFGSATVVFEKCKIVSSKNSYITDASTTIGKEFGFVFIECEVTAKENVSEVYLGRP